MMKNQVLYNQHVFVSVAASWVHRITINNLPRFKQAKSMGEARIAQQPWDLLNYYIKKIIISGAADLTASFSNGRSGPNYSH